MAEVTFTDVTKVFPGGSRAVDRLDLAIEDGELLVVVGPSGSGKTTVLRLLAGLEELTEGEISIDGRVVNHLHPMDRDIAMVFQSYALYPHMTVAENIGFGLKLRHRPKREIRERAAIQRLQNDLGTTTMYVTHDQVEAMTMGDRVAVMRDGRLIQVDTPQALYAGPADMFVAGFIGSPAMNFVRARLEGSNGSLFAAFGSTRLELPSRMGPASAARRGD